MSGFRLPLAVSIAGHAIFLILLVWLGSRLPPLRWAPPAPPNAIAVIFAPPPQPAVVAPPAPPQPAPAPPPKVVEAPKPPPPPPPKVVEAPQPPPRPIVRHVQPKPRPRPRRVVRRRIERPVRRVEPQRRAAVEPPLPAIPPRYAAPETAALPPTPVRRVPAAPMVSLAYRDALAGWFAAHKHYPESARDRGEQGEGLLRFRVDRYGRVLNYALVRSTGYPDLDSAIEAMMQGAVLPPFPSDMAANDIEVTMPFAFRLER